jgi:virginiamycin A acetyltransferase
LNVFSAIKRRTAACLALSSHPHVRNSSVADYRTIDPTARISDSSLWGSVAVGRRAILDNCQVTGNAKVSVGAYSILSGPIRIVADLESVSIGKFCSLAPDVVIWESMHNMRRASTFFMLREVFGERCSSDIISHGAIRIGNDVWIGAKAIVLSGVEIGDGAVIGAGAVVTKDVPPYCIAVGLPATVVGQRFPEALSRRLLEISWWDWDEDTIKRNRALFEQELSLEVLDHLSC